MTENNEEKTYSIGEVETIVGYNRLTIKKYVNLGFVPCRRNPINNYRVFTQEAIDILKKIKAGQYEAKD